MMKVTFTCCECGSGIHVYPSVENNRVQCDICQHEFTAHFTKEHEAGKVEICPACDRKDFYKQKDFNRKIGVIMFLIPTAICIFIGLIEGIIGYVVFWLLDVMLFKSLQTVVVCYKCHTLFRDISNMDEIHDYNHEMNDRIAYGDEDFGGRTLEH